MFGRRDGRYRSSSMAKSNSPISPLVRAAAAVDEELRAYDELASDALRIEIDGEKSIARAARMLEDATARQPRIQEKLRALVGEIEAARIQQQKSLDTLVEVSQALQARATQYGELMDRFAELGEAARGVNALTTTLSARRNEGAGEGELLAGLQELEQRMDTVVERADSLAQDAEQHGWPEIARQADAVRQQVRAAKNKLSLAHRTMAGRAPS
jgi:chromosome segregation ATPase